MMALIRVLPHRGRLILAILLVVFLAPIHAAGSARAEILVTGISDNTISISSNFTGAELVLFGTVERDAQSIARRQGYDIVVIVRGPQQAITVRQKERIAGIWANRNAWTFDDAYGFLAILSNRPLADIASESARDDFAIGLTRQNYTASNGNATFSNEQRLAFSEALLRQMQARQLYLQNEEGVEFLSDTLFTARIAVPAYVPVGTFEADIMLFGDGALLAQQTVELDVRKTGFEQFTYALATEQPLVYGVVAVILAVLAGWLASVMFKRD
jgi:uncharacterized protein (TIGR02186 family)